ncbi:FG-GAP repeat protein [unidentified eubacterium SCB49]|nr:FG-GAP repeat protein [unidentified eubacterium SCB49]
MKKIYLLLGLCPILSVQSQNFEEVETDMKDYYYSSSNVADFDGDGFVDIVFNGAIDSDNNGEVDTTFNEVYKNDDATFTLFDDLGLYATHLGDIKFLDFDNDGLLDIVSTGLSYNDITDYQQYRLKNTGTSLELEENISGKIFGSLEVFDFNHDGFVDYALNGIQYIEEDQAFSFDLDFYQNNGDGFDVTPAWLSGTQSGAFKVLDLNNDNLLDLVISGFNIDYEPIFKVYLNNNGVLEFSQDLAPISDGEIAYTDFNADGFLDLAVVGVDLDYNEYLAVLINDGTGNFTTNVIDNEGVSGSSIDVGDLNNDGYYDFIIIGNDADYNGWVKVFLYDNNTESFTKSADTGLYNLGSNGDINLFDYNNDNHLDVMMSGFDWADSDFPSLTKLFTNLSTEENQKPLPPTELDLTQDDNKYTFTWSGASDDKTPTNALQYEIKVGTTSGAQDVAKYIVTTPSWFLELENMPENLYWSVKSIDASKILSNSSDEQQLSVSDFSLLNNIKVYPNPASGKVFVSAEGLIAVEMYDIQGRKINVKLNSDFSLDISGLSSGVYVLKMNVDGVLVSRKLSVN